MKAGIHSNLWRCALILAVAAGWSGASQIRNVILCIGDGMGDEQVTAAHCFLGAPLSFEQSQWRGHMATASANSAVTDSAASSTAMATGRKVNNGVISMAYPGDGQALETILERWKSAGRSCGLVTTTVLTHATPAAFAAHDPGRNAVDAIALDYLTQTRPDVLLGGGGSGLYASNVVAASYALVTNRAELLTFDTEAATNVAGLFGASHLPYEGSGLGDLPHLSEMTGVALSTLDNNPEGFFLMVEGGRIDHAAHNNNLALCIGEVIEFGHAVEAVLQWASNRTDTLVIVTADHETGGLRVLRDNGPGVLPTVSWSTTYHTAVPVSIRAWGANAAYAIKVTDNTEVYHLMKNEGILPPLGVHAQPLADGACFSAWSAVSGSVYRLERADELGSGTNLWTPLQMVTAQSDRVDFLDDSVVSDPVFYRVKEVR